LRDLIWSSAKKPVKQLFIFFTVLKNVKKSKNSEEIINFLHFFLTFSNLYLLFFTVLSVKKALKKDKDFFYKKIQQHLTYAYFSLNYFLVRKRLVFLACGLIEISKYDAKMGQEKCTIQWRSILPAAKYLLRFGGSR
jgi:hypothetical protein